MVTRAELPDTLTVSEVADILGVKPGTVRALVSQGEMEYVGDDVGDRNLSTDSFVEYVNRRYSGGKRYGPQDADFVGRPGDAGPGGA